METWSDYRDVGVVLVDQGGARVLVVGELHLTPLSTHCVMPQWVDGKKL